MNRSWYLKKAKVDKSKVKGWSCARRFRLGKMFIKHWMYQK